MRKLTAGAALAAVLLATAFVSGAPVLADDSEAEATYSRYHRSIEAAKLCRKMSFDQDAHSRMAGVIHARIEHKIGAKRLRLLTAAQREAKDMVKKQGCDGAEVMELLALFDSDLAPVLQ
ncbi:MAG: hypothetical protein MI920_04985 [Kiloniellales bacterium]|nr:hypothetical protein [Kiloniellales bacterium]